MPRRPAHTDAQSRNAEFDEIDRQNSGIKMIAELIADTDDNLPNETIDDDIIKFSSHGDVSNWEGIPLYFDSLSSMSRRASTYPNWKNRFLAVDYLQSCFNTLKEKVIDYIESYFAANENGQEHVRDVKLVNAVNMFVVLATRLTIQLQLHVSKTVAAAASQSKRGQRNRHGDVDDDCFRWKETQRFRMINCLLELLELQVNNKKRAIQYLFAPDVMEKDFIQRFMDMVTNLLEDPENAIRSNQPWIVHYFRIWKRLAATYDMAPKIANSLFTDTLELPYLEAATNFPFIEPLVYLMKEHSASRKSDYQPLRVVLEMVVRRACTLYSGERMDRPPPKAFCMIIQSLAINVHELMLKDLSQIYLLLHNPHPNVRSCALQALADMFSSPFLAKEWCDQYTSRKNKRNSIFEKLVAHTNDEATNVRTKAVSLLRSLMENHRIPEEFESSGLLQIVGSRLNDKSVQVRKCAIQFLTVYLDKNRYGHDFNREDHVVKLDAKIKEFRSFQQDGNHPVQAAERLFKSKWGILRGSLIIDIPNFIKGDLRVDCNNPPPIARIMEKIFDVGMGTELLKYYVCQDSFPYQRTEEDDRRAPDNATVELIYDWVLRQAEEDFINYSMQMRQTDDARLLEDEQEKRDKAQTISQMRSQIQHLVDKMVIERHLSGCVDLALRCVLMGDTAEIKEGIKFLTRCKLFEITGAEAAIRSMCTLVWRPGSDVLNELIDAAEDMFISKLDGNEKASERDKSTVENLLKAMNGATEKDRPSIEEVIFLLASSEGNEDSSSKNVKKRRAIETNVITKLWAIALDSTRTEETAMKEKEKRKEKTGRRVEKDSDAVVARRVDALRILYPISRTEIGLPEARNRLRSLQKKLSEEPKIAVEALRIISILATPTKLEQEYNSYKRPLFRIHQEDSLFKSIETLMFHEIVKADNDPKRDWFGIIRLSISTIINVSMDFNTLLPKIAAHFLYRTKKMSEFYLFYCKQVEDKNQDAMTKVNAERRRDYWALTWCRTMEKLMAFCGEVATQIHVFLQLGLPKLHNRYVTKMLEAEKNDSKLREEPARLLSDIEKSIAQRKAIFGIPTDSTPGAAATYINPFMTVLCNKRIFAQQKLLGRLLPIVVYGMRTRTMPPRVRQAAVTAFGKFMPISAEICSFAGPSFATLMTKSKSPLTRCNLIAACCDFAFSQPTYFEFYAHSLFRMAQDKQCAAARESTILVLSHLMSQDMIQPRGVLSEPIRCIADSHPAVMQVAQSFFKEIFSRNDVVSSLLPEFIFRLSCTDERLPFKQYKVVFDFLIQLFKEKAKASTENLITRVCSKFSTVDMSDMEAPRYLLVALTKFAQNDGGVQKLQENWRYWSKFLCHTQVAKEYRHMIEHLQNTTKSEEVKHQCTELVRNIDKIQEEGLSKDDMAPVSVVTRKGKSRAGRPPGAKASSPGSSITTTRTPRRRRRAATPSDESDPEDVEMLSEPESD